MSSTAAACPVCHSSSSLVRTLPAIETKRILSGLFQADIPDTVNVLDYTVQECAGCGLAFADPMVAGDDGFYGWITKFDRYQSKGRWEWKALKQQLQRQHAKTMFEVGAGTGKLMQFLSDVDGLNCSGIDISPASAAAARDLGFDVKEAAFDDLNDVLDQDQTFDAIVLSHVLEHVSDPRGVMENLLARVSGGGCIMAAVPYSPMSRELTDWDIMNLPPHHMTRWNAQSLRGLADILGCSVELHTAKAKSPLRRAIQDTCGEVLGDKHPSTLKRITTVLFNYPVFKEFLSRHRDREQVNGRMAGESVLAVFFRA